jgi:hypothetical protein
MKRRFVLAGLCGLVIVLAGAAAAVSPTVERSLAAPGCDPIQTPPSFRGEVPTAEQVLGFPLGSQEVTSAESNTYVDAVDAASPRVISGTVTTSWLGRPFRFALVGKPGSLSRNELPRIQASLRRLMDPTTPPREADRIARTTPAILWLLGNVHGGEESGTDSELRILFELADRDDCAARQILDDAVVGIMPTQNPDGREAETRENFYRFDMNRDWFARTQRETDPKIELLRQFPGILHVDAHEMGGADYFFPPNADPIHHEHTDFTVDVTDNLYGPALAAEFNRQGIPFFTNQVFDFFAPVFGDTTPSHIFGSVGMTFEKEAGDPISQRTHEHYVTQWVALSQGALNRESLLRRWHGEWVQAFQEGLAGRLQPNEVNDPGNTVERPVPTDPVRHYFIRADEPSKAREVQSLVRRLQRTDVAVYRLTAPLAVPDFKEYGRPMGAAVLPAGTYWIPMAQQQKHWIQALLGEDTYVPFRYFFDVSGWNNVMLFNVTGGRSGAVLNPAATLVGLLPQPPDPPLPPVVPSVAVFQPGTTTSANQSTGWLRYLLEQRWHLPYQSLTAAQIAGGGLAGKDVLIVPSGSATAAFNSLGPTGRQAIVNWVNAGGRYVGFRRGGSPLAAMLGITSATLREPNSEVAGALLRVAVNPASPLGTGIGPFGWVFYDFDLVMTASNAAHVALRYPAASSPDFFMSGFGEGHEELGETAAVVDEPRSSGRVILFSTDPNFRAWTDGMQRVLHNAVLGPAPTGAPASLATDRAEAQASAASLLTLDSPVRISVRPLSAERTKTLIEGYTKSYVVRSSPGRVSFVIANPRGLSAEEHPFAADLARDVDSSGIDVIAFSAP